MKFSYYTGKLRVSIRAVYDTGNIGQYYRDLYLDELSAWLDAHTYTHPGVISYTIKIDTFYNEKSRE